MISENDIGAVWKPKELHRASRQVVDGLSIPHDQKEYLHKLGLPNVEHLLLEFDLSKPLPLLSKLSSTQNVPEEYKGLKVIGTQDGEPSICLDEKRSGQLWSVDATGQDLTRYINCGVREFGLFLTVHKRDYLRPGLSKLPDKAIRLIINTIETEYRAIDKSALDNQENWWSVILEQMKDGLL